MFSKKAILLSLLVSTAFGAPSPVNDLVKKDTQELHGWDLDSGKGRVSVYGYPGAPTSDKREDDIIERDVCKAPKSLSCNHDNLANSQVCAELGDSLLGPRSVGDVPGSPRSICLEGNGGKCCLSWSNGVAALKYQGLYEPLKEIQNTCSGYQGTSGKQTYTPLGNGCVSFCISNRDSHCS